MVKNTWELLPQPSEQVVRQLVEQLNINVLAAKVLAQKGYTTPELAYAYLTPNVSQLHDPLLLHDMDKAVARLTEAAFGGEKIVIYGDYDLDGVTSTAVMLEALEVLGADVETYIPNRFEDGYGPNLSVYKKLIDDGAQVIITVDNGVSGHEAVAYAMSVGVDVIITDHHQLPEKLPEAHAIVHPRYPDSGYPFGDLSGVGVAFKVAQALLTEGQPITDKSDLPIEMLDLVALGEIADMVSLTDENRTLVSWGLQQLSSNPRPGIAELLKNAGQEDNQLVNSDTVGFKIAPRLNAVGRLGDAKLALDLLLTQDSDKAIDIATQVEAINSQRQEIVEEVFGAAKQIALSPKNKNQQVLVVAGEAWHQGILGIVASRLVELLHKPVVVLSKIDGVYKGSGRSFGNLDLYQLMARYRDLYMTFGGHAGALGLALTPENLEKLYAEIDNLEPIAIAGQKILVNDVLSVDQITTEAYEAVQLLEPFGTDNMRPLFEVKESSVDKAVTMGATNQHIRLTLSNRVEAVGFNHPEWATAVRNPKSISFVGALGMNHFRGKQSVQLLITDIDLPNEDGKQSHKALFSKVYKFIYTHQDLNFAQNLDKIAKQLQISQSDLNIMVQVFIELGFVKIINGGFVQVIPDAPQRDLTLSVTYQKFLANR